MRNRGKAKAFIIGTLILISIAVVFFIAASRGNNLVIRGKNASINNIDTEARLDFLESMEGKLWGVNSSTNTYKFISGTEEKKYWVEGKGLFIKELPAYFYHEIPSVPGINQISYTRVYKNEDIVKEIIHEEKIIKDAEPSVTMHGDATISRYAYSILCNLYTWAEDSDNLTWRIENTNLVVKLNGSNFFIVDSAGMDFAHYPSFDELKIVFKILGYDNSQIDEIKIAYDEIKNGARTAEAGLAFLVNDKFGFRMAAPALGVSDEAYKATLDLDAIYEANKGNWY